MKKELLPRVERKVGYMTLNRRTVLISRAREQTGFFTHRVLRSVAFTSTGTSESVNVQGVLL